MKKIFLLISTLFMANSIAVEELKYNVLLNDGAMEIRKYEPYIKASVSYENREQFESEAFNTLADYIFGNNISSEDIAMTAPVMTNEQIAMTAPVMMKEENQNWTMSFSMPSKFTMETLPRPVNKDVIISQVNEKLYASLEYSGFDSDQKRQENYALLFSWINEDTDYEIAGAPVFAGYNPPWTLPFLRRNEVLIPVK